MRVIKGDGSRCMSVKAIIQRMLSSTRGWKRQRTEIWAILNPQSWELILGLLDPTLLWSHMLSPPAFLSEHPLQWMPLFCGLELWLLPTRVKWMPLQCMSFSGTGPGGSTDLCFWPLASVDRIIRGLHSSCSYFCLTSPSLAPLLSIFCPPPPTTYLPAICCLLNNSALSTRTYFSTTNTKLRTTFCLLLLGLYVP